VGRWQIGDPAPTSLYGPKQLGATVSGRYALVTGAAAGRTASANDLDGGTTTVRSAPIALPADPEAFGDLTFRYYFAHRPDSSSADWFRAIVESQDGTQTVVMRELGAANDDDAAWATARASLDAWAGQSIRLIFQARDGARGSLVEAAVDDVRISR